MLNTQDLLNNIECFHHTSTDTFSGPNPPYHRHEKTYEIYLYIKGNILLYVEENCYKLTSGDIILVRPNELHRSVIIDNSPYERIAINIDKDTLNALSSNNTDLTACFNFENNAGRITHLPLSDLNKYVALVDQYLKSESSDAFGSDIECMIDFMKIFVLLNKCFMQNSSTEQKNYMPSLVANIMNYINDNLTTDLSLGDISAHVNYSTTYICLQFKKHTGLTIRDYIIDKRLELAKKILEEGKSVSEACFSSGFNDYANFIRTFTKRVGISPGKYHL